MLNMMICKQHEQEHKRFRFCKERFIVMSVSEKQIMSDAGGNPMDA